MYDLTFHVVIQFINHLPTHRRGAHKIFCIFPFLTLCITTLHNINKQLFLDTATSDAINSSNVCLNLSFMNQLTFLILCEHLPLWKNEVSIEMHCRKFSCVFSYVLKFWTLWCLRKLFRTVWIFKNKTNLFNFQVHWKVQFIYITK